MPFCGNAHHLHIHSPYLASLLTSMAWILYKSMGNLLYEVCISQESIYRKNSLVSIELICARADVDQLQLLASQSGKMLILLRIMN